MIRRGDKRPDQGLRRRPFAAVYHWPAQQTWSKNTLFTCIQRNSLANVAGTAENSIDTRRIKGTFEGTGDVPRLQSHAIFFATELSLNNVYDSYSFVIASR